MGPFNDFTRDVRYALRQLARAPGFAVTAILCLALGIGVATTILSVANVVLLQPLPLAEPDRLVIVNETLPPGRPGGQIMTMRGIPHGDLLVWRRGTTSLSDGAGLLMGGQVMARTPRGMAGLWGGATTPNAFTMLGVRPILGLRRRGRHRFSNRPVDLPHVGPALQRRPPRRRHDPGIAAGRRPG